MLAARTGPLAAVRRLYRGRWQGARVGKRMPPRRRLKPIRSTQRTSVAAPVRALRLAWALQEGALAALRAQLPTGTLPAPTPVSSWLRTGLGLDTRRQPGQGPWSHARLQACRPRLPRLLVRSPRQREPQETQVRAWLLGPALLRPSNAQEAAEGPRRVEKTYSTRLWGKPPHLSLSWLVCRRKFWYSGHRLALHSHV